MPSTAAQIIISIIPIVGIVMGSIVVFAYLLWDYKLRFHMIEKGIQRTKYFDLDSFCLLSGLILFILGMSLMLFFLLKDGFSYGVLSGLITTAIGLSMLLFVFIRSRMKQGDE